jgi:esterase/lipase
MRRHILTFIFIISISSASKGLNPSPKYYYTPDSLGLNYQALKFNSDTFQLNAWDILPAKGVANKHCTIIVANSDAGNMSSNLFMAKSLADIGYTVFLFDYRGFGQSSPFEIDKQMLYYSEFAEDLGKAIHLNRKLSRNRIGVLGLSMGTLICLMAMQKNPVDFFIAESLVYDPFSVIDFYKKKQSERKILLPSDAKSYAAFLENTKIKVMIIAGKKDEVCPINSAYQLHRKNSNISVIAHKGGHLQGLMELSSSTKHIGDIYAQKIDAFISGQ